jgi:hypothetical protein
MKVNTRKTITERIDLAISLAGRQVESIELDRAERHELYKSGALNFQKYSDVTRPELRGHYYTRAARWIDILAQEEC